MAEYVAATLAADVDRLGPSWPTCPGDDDARPLAADPRLFSSAGSEERELTGARLELTVAATRDAALAESLAAWRGRLVGVVDGIMAAADKEHGAPRAEALVASLDGLLLAALLKPQRRRRAFLSGARQLLG